MPPPLRWTTHTVRCLVTLTLTCSRKDALDLARVIADQLPDKFDGVVNSHHIHCTVRSNKCIHLGRQVNQTLQI